MTQAPAKAPAMIEKEEPRLSEGTSAWLPSVRLLLGLSLAVLATVPVGCGQDDAAVNGAKTPSLGSPFSPSHRSPLTPPTGLEGIRKKLGLRTLAPETLRRSLQRVGDVQTAQALLSLVTGHGNLPDSGFGLRGEPGASGDVSEGGDAAASKTVWKDIGSGGLHDWRLYHKGLPVERVQIKEQREQGRSVFAQGNVPNRLAAALSSPWPDTLLPDDAEDFALSEATAKDAVAWRLNFHPWRLTSVEKVYVADESAFVPAYRIFVDSSADLPGRGPGFPLSVLLDARTGDVIEQTPVSFHVDGKALVFDENEVVNEQAGRKEIALPGLVAPGERLQHSLFGVYNCNLLSVSSACQQTAEGVAGDFRAVDFNSKSYDEVVAYHAMTKSMAWYRRVMALKPNPSAAWGAKYPGSRANFGISSDLTFNVYTRSRTDTKSGSTLDNAAYMPSNIEKGDQAKILVGTGWEEGQPGQTVRLLRYLGRDSDVVMHEFAHHVIYRTLRYVSDRTVGSIHEGTADYLTYAITNNNLLGESVVAVGDSLRAGNKTGTVEPYLVAKAHIQGEFWSSTLWDVRQTLGPWKQGIYIFDKIVWEAIDLLKQDADYYDFIAALSRSAEQFAKAEGRPVAALRNSMFNVFHKRGFLLAPNQEGTLPAMNPALAEGANYSAPPPAVTEEPVQEEEHRPWYQCGVVAGQGAHAGKTSASSTSWALVALLLLPLCAPLATHLANHGVKQAARLHRQGKEGNKVRHSVSE